MLVPLDNVYMRVAERALEQEWGSPPVFSARAARSRVGALFDSELRAPVIFMGTGLPDDNIHAPNEKYNVCPLLPPDAPGDPLPPHRRQRSRRRLRVPRDAQTRRARRHAAPKRPPAPERRKR